MRNLIIIIIVLCSYMVVHESIHYVIFMGYGCDEIEVHWNNITGVCTEKDVLLAQAIAEIVGYGVSMPLFIILGILLIKPKTI